MSEIKKKVAFISLGCPKNTVDSEIMLHDLVENGFEITNREDLADVIVINTCAFINDALEESIETVIRAGTLKAGKLEKIIVAGCMSKRYGLEVFQEMPEVDGIIDTANCLNISEVIRNTYHNGPKAFIGDEMDIGYLNRPRIYDPLLPYEYVKISEGCNNNCTFCIIPSLRGRYRSREMETILSECRDIIRYGKKELIVIAQDTANYGRDIYKTQKLKELVSAIAELDPHVLVRVMYTYPEFLYDDLFDIFKYPNVARYLDIPIQHTDDKIRAKMNRRKSMDYIMEKIRHLKERVPDIYLRTSLITGFPGETEDNHRSMLAFLEQDIVDYAGIFKFSPQEGTKAADMPDQIDEETKERRRKELYDVVTEKLVLKAENSIGKTFRVLCEGISDDGIFYRGRTAYQAPDIDTAVYFTSENEVETGDFVSVKILNRHHIDMIGEVTNECSQ